jgi:HPt (histidine-containing phosphotransfer) domain-containing protein
MMSRNARSSLERPILDREDATRGRAGTAPAVDLVHLGRFTLGNRALELEVLAIFESQIGGHIARLEDAGCHKSWREAAHTIKGTAWAIGAWRLGKIAEDAERLGMDGPPEVRRAFVAELASAADDVTRFIADCLAGGCPHGPERVTGSGGMRPVRPRANEAP